MMQPLRFFHGLKYTRRSLGEVFTLLNPQCRNAMIHFGWTLGIIGTLLSHGAWASDPAITPNFESAPLGSPQNTATIGWEFAVKQPITVTDLGMYDADLDGLVESHQVGIWNLAGLLLVQATLNSGAEGKVVGHFRYVAVQATVLAPGNYVIGVQYNSHSPDAFPQDPLASSATTFTGISFIQPRYGFGSSLTFPNVGQGIGNGFNHFGPNFLVSETTSTPEAPTLNLAMYAGLTLVGTVGTKYQIQYVTDINQTNNWLTLTNVTLTSNPYLFVDIASTNSPKRYYRAIVSP